MLHTLPPPAMGLRARRHHMSEHATPVAPRSSLAERLKSFGARAGQALAGFASFLVIAVGTRITYVHPLRENNKVIGMRYADIPAQWPAVKRIIDGGVPVLVHGRYWGLISTVMDSKSLLSNALGTATAQGMEIAVRIAAINRCYAQPRSAGILNGIHAETATRDQNCVSANASTLPEPPVTMLTKPPACGRTCSA